MLGIGSDFDDCIRACPHQQIVDLAFVLVSNIRNLFGQREDEMEVAHGQQFGFACSQPCLCGTGLALGAVPIAAGVIGDVFVRAALTTRHVTTKRRRAATLDRTHDLQLIKANMACIGQAPDSTMGAEDVRDFQI